MSQGMHCVNCVKKFLARLKYASPHRFRAVRAIHDAPEPLRASFMSNGDVNERVTSLMNEKPTRSLIKDGPSLKDFLASSTIDVTPNEEFVPYVQDIRGGNQKGFRYMSVV